MRLFDIYNIIIDNYDNLLSNMIKVDKLNVDYSIISKAYQSDDIKNMHLNNINKQLNEMVDNNYYYGILSTYLRYPNFDMKLKIDYNKATIDDSIFICKVEEKFDLLKEKYLKDKILALKTTKLIINDIYKLLFEEIELDKSNYLFNYKRLYNSLGNTNDKNDSIIVDLLPSLALHKAYYNNSITKFEKISYDYINYLLNNANLIISDDLIYEKILNDNYCLNNLNSWTKKGYINFDNRTVFLRKIR